MTVKDRIAEGVRVLKFEREKGVREGEKLDVGVGKEERSDGRCLFKGFESKCCLKRREKLATLLCEVK